MNLFIDTEFNSYKGAFISIALVDENGKYFYETVGCFEPDLWVAANVMPVLNKEPISYTELQNKLIEFLLSYPSFNIVADYPDDFRYFCELLMLGPGKMFTMPPFTMEFVADYPSTSRNSRVPHNALEDARVLLTHWRAINGLPILAL